MKIETKLGFNTGVLILALFISALIAHMRLREANRLSDLVTNQRLPIISLVRDIRFSHVAASRALESSLLLGADPAAYARYGAERQDRLAAGDNATAVLIQHIRQLGPGPETAQVQHFQAQFAELRNLEDQLASLGEVHTPAAAGQARDLLAQRVLPLDEEFLTSLDNFVKSQVHNRDIEMDRLGRANRAVPITLWTATIAGAIFGGLISFILARRIARAIGLVAGRASAIASGDLTGAPLDVRSTDQIGLLARAMQQMQANLGDIVGTVAQTSSSLTASAVSMSSATEHIHRRIKQQSQQTQQAATAMQEMSASIAEVSRHAHSAAETARSAAETAREGGAVVNHMLSAMDSIASAVSETSSTIGLLGEDSYRISQIVTVIDEIATKTNLLALNAAIEAARAGDHGRGFAVVAGEVRHLAESTAQATGKISAMIEGIQNRTRTAIAGMASGTVIVQQGVVTTNQAGEALERIIGMAERVDRMIAQIAIAASQQAHSADESTYSLDAIHSLSSENLAEMVTTASGIESLRATVAALESQLDKFRLDIPRPMPAPPRALTTTRVLPYPRIA